MTLTSVKSKRFATVVATFLLCASMSHALAASRYSPSESSSVCWQSGQDVKGACNQGGEDIVLLRRGGLEQDLNEEPEPEVEQHTGAVQLHPGKDESDLHQFRAPSVARTEDRAAHWQVQTLPLYGTGSTRGIPLQAEGSSQSHTTPINQFEGPISSATESDRPKLGKGRTADGMRGTLEHKAKMRIIQQTITRLPFGLPLHEQIRLHTQELIKAKISIPSFKSLRNSIDYARRKIMLQQVIHLPPEARSQRLLKMEQRAVVRRVAKKVRDKPLEERQKILGQEFEKMGVEKPWSFSRSVARMSMPHARKRLAKGEQGSSSAEKRKTNSPAQQSSTKKGHQEARPHARSLGQDDLRNDVVLVRRGLRSDGLEIDLNSTPTDHDAQDHRSSELQTTYASTAKQVNNSPYLPHEDQGAYLILPAIANQNTRPFNGPQKGKRLAESDLNSGKMTKHQRTRAGLLGLLPPEEQKMYEHRSQFIRKGQAKKAGTSRISKEDTILHRQEDVVNHSTIPKTASTSPVPSTTLSAHAAPPVADNNEGIAASDQRQGSVLTVEEAQKLNRHQRNAAGLTGRLPHDMQVSFEYRSEIIRQGQIKREANKHLSKKEYKNLVYRERASKKRKAEKGKLSQEEKERYMKNQQYFAKAGTSRVDLTVPPPKLTSVQVIRGISRQLLKLKNDNDGVKMIHDAHIQAGVTPPTEEKARSKMYHLRWRAANNRLKPEKESEGPRLLESGQTHLHRRSLVASGESERVHLSRRMLDLDLNASPKTSVESDGPDHQTRKEDQEVSSALVPGPSSRHDTSSNTASSKKAQEYSAGRDVPFNVPFRIEPDSIASISAATPSGPSSSTAYNSRGKRKALHDKYEGVDMAKVRKGWREDKVKVRMAHRREFPEGALKAFDTRSKLIREAHLERQEWEEADPDKKGNKKEWKRKKDRDRKTRRRRAVKGQTSAQEIQEYEERRQAYSHLVDRPKAPQIMSSYTVMRSISSKLQSTTDLQKKKALIAQALAEAGLPIPPPEILKQKAKNARMYLNRKKREEAAAGKLPAGTSKSTPLSSRPSAPLVRRGIEESADDFVLQHQARPDIDLNASPALSTASKEESTGVNDGEVQSRLLTSQSTDVHDAASLPTTSTSRGKRMTLNDRYNDQEIDMVRQVWRSQKVKARMAEKGELPEEVQQSFMFHSQTVRDAHVEKGEWEKANPDKKGDKRAWRRYKDKKTKDRRRKYLKNELSPQEKEDYERRRRVYSHLTNRPVKPKKPTSNAIMQSISKELQQTPGPDQKIALIAQALSKAGLPVPPPKELLLKAKNAHLYTERKRLRESGGGLNPSSSNAGTFKMAYQPLESSPLVRRVVEEDADVGSIVLQRRGRLEIDLNALPTLSTKSSEEPTTRDGIEEESRPSVSLYADGQSAAVPTAAPNSKRVRKRKGTDAFNPDQDQEMKRQRQRQYNEKAALAYRSNLSKEQRELLDARSEYMRIAQEEKEEWVKANPHKDLSAWTRYKDKESKTRRRKYLNNELTLQERQEYDRRRHVYAHNTFRPKALKIVTSNSIMRSLSIELQQMSDPEAKRELIAQALAKANLPVPSAGKILLKAKNADKYLQHKQMMQSERPNTSSFHAAPSKPASHPPSLLRRDLGKDAIEADIVLQRRGVLDLDLNASPKSSTTSREETAARDDVEVQSQSPFAQQHQQPHTFPYVTTLDKPHLSPGPSASAERSAFIFRSRKDLDDKLAKKEEYAKSKLAREHKLEPVMQLLYKARGDAIKRGKEAKIIRMEQARLKGGEAAVAAVEAEYKRLKGREKKRRRDAFANGQMTPEEREGYLAHQELFGRHGKRREWNRAGL